MTNVESLLQDAVAALNAGKLSGKAKEFIEQIKNYHKRRLKKLTSAQYTFLRNIVEDNPV